MYFLYFPTSYDNSSFECSSNSNVPYFQVRDVRLISDRITRRSKGVGYVLDYQIVSFSYACIIHILRYQIPRIMFNCILKWTSIAIMMRDDGNTMHSCLINSCCVRKVDDIILVCFGPFS